MNSAWETQCPSNPYNTVTPSPGTVTIESLAPGFVLTVSKGGTGATNAAKARFNLGIKDKPGATTSGYTQYLTTSSISAHSVVALTSSGIVAATSLDYSHAATAFGITAVAAGKGSLVDVISLGEFEDSSWVLIPFLPIFLGIEGQLTQTIPTAPSLFILRVGVALSATKMLISFYPSISIA